MLNFQGWETHSSFVWFVRTCWFLSVLLRGVIFSCLPHYFKLWLYLLWISSSVTLIEDNAGIRILVRSKNSLLFPRSDTFSTKKGILTTWLLLRTTNRTTSWSQASPLGYSTCTNFQSLTSFTPWGEGKAVVWFKKLQDRCVFSSNRVDVSPCSISDQRIASVAINSSGDWIGFGCSRKKLFLFTCVCVCARALAYWCCRVKLKR